MWDILFLLIIFIPTIETVIPFMNYWDECLFVVISVAFLFRKFKIHINKELIKIVKGVLALFIIGIVSNWMHPEFQSSYIAIIKDIGAIIKFPIIMFMLLNLRTQNVIKSNTVMLSKTIIIMMIGFAFIGYVVDIGVYLDEIRLLKCYKFYYSHPTFLVSSVIMIICVLLCDGLNMNKMYLIIASLLLFLSGRSKAYFMVAFLGVLFLINSFKLISINMLRNEFKMKKLKVYLFGIVLLILSYLILKDKVSLYMAWGMTAARPALHIVGLELLLDCFPLGSGFGTFASSISGDYYSDVYNIYGISHVNGLIEGDSNYIADTFWPYIYGQFGLSGIIIYLAIMTTVFNYQCKKISDNNKLMAFIFAWVYAFVACLAEAFFTNSTGVQLAMLLGIYIGTDAEKGVYSDIQKEYSV